MCLLYIMEPKEKMYAYRSDHLQFACCGINGSSNYGTSWWRLQEVGRRELVVPLSCCTLNNANETGSFLNPEPANLTLCQALNPAEHQYARHTAVCAIMRKLLSPLPCRTGIVRTRDETFRIGSR